MLIIPAIDILRGKCVRLYNGDFKNSKVYFNDILEVAKRFETEGAKFLHIVDLDGAKKGKLKNQKIILDIAKKIKIPIQIGGGIRSYSDAKKYLDNGVYRIILSTVAVKDPFLIKKIIQEYGSDRIAVSLDVYNEKIAIKGWVEKTGISIFDTLNELKKINIKNFIVTDISKDGALVGPNFDIIKKIIKKGFNVIVAGGISEINDLKELKKIGINGAIIGKAIYENKINLAQACKLFTPKSSLTKRIIPCMDVCNGRVVKGINFKNLKNISDPSVLGKFYSDCGADELVFLDITATIEKRKTLINLVKKIAKNVYIPFTVGGGIKTLEDIRDLLNAGADKISICSTAITNPEFVKLAAKQFGSQCIVISLDCKKDGDSWKLYIKGGREKTEIDAIKFAKKMEKLGAGELLINSLDRDGTKDGYDIELLKKISESVNIPVIASSGAGKNEDFLQAFKEGNVDAVLAASVFHYNEIKINELKNYLNLNNINVRI